MNLFRRIALAASYVTSIPCLKKAESEDELKGLAKFLPTVGIIIGAFLAVIAFACNRGQISPLLTCLFLLFAWLGITGAIHMDGFMDSADGLFSHRSREKMLEIMKDSRVGNFGAIAGMLMLLAKYVGLLSLPSSWLLPAILIIPAWARWVEVFSIASYPYARDEGMGKVWHDSTQGADLLSSAALPSLLTVALCFYFHSHAFSLIVPLTVLPGIAFSYWVNKILNGQTGDTYGAAVEFSEAAALVLLAMLYKFM